MRFAPRRVASKQHALASRLEHRLADMDSAAAVRLKTLHEVATLRRQEAEQDAQRRQEAEQAAPDAQRGVASYDSANAWAFGQPWSASVLVPSLASGSLALLCLALVLRK
jgi:hypothetical protein